MVAALPDLQIGRLSLLPDAPVVDRSAAERAVVQLLAALGVDAGSEIGANTPRRVADAFAQMLSQEPWEFTKFRNDSQQDDLVVTGGIGFTSVCGHHLLPFSGTATIGYRPHEWLPGLSKVARTVRMFAATLQTQENLGHQIARFVQQQLSCHGVAVLLQAEHSCMTCRGVLTRGAQTVTIAATGLLQTDATARAEFLQLASLPRCSV